MPIQLRRRDGDNKYVADVEIKKGTSLAKDNYIAFPPENQNYTYETTRISSTNAATLHVVADSANVKDIKGHYLTPGQEQPQADDKNQIYENAWFANNQYPATSTAEKVTFKYTHFGNLEKTFTDDVTKDIKEVHIPYVQDTTNGDSVRSEIENNASLKEMFYNSSSIQKVDLSGLRGKTTEDKVQDIFPPTHKVIAKMETTSEVGKRIKILDHETNAWSHSITDDGMEVYLDQSMVNAVYVYNKRSSALPAESNDPTQWPSDQITHIDDATFTSNILKLLATGTEYEINMIKTGASTDSPYNGQRVQSIAFFFNDESSSKWILDSYKDEDDLPWDESFPVITNNKLKFKIHLPSDDSNVKFSGDKVITAQDIKYIWKVIINIMEDFFKYIGTFTDTAGNPLMNPASASFFGNSEPYGIRIYNDFIDALGNTYPDFQIRSAKGNDFLVIPVKSQLQIDVNESSSSVKMGALGSKLEFTNTTGVVECNVTGSSKVGTAALNNVNFQATFYPNQDIHFTCQNNDTLSHDTSGIFVARYPVSYKLVKPVDSGTEDIPSEVVNGIGDVFITNRQERSIKPTVTLAIPPNVQLPEKATNVDISIGDKSLWSAEDVDITSGQIVVPTDDVSNVMDAFINGAVTITITLVPTVINYDNVSGPIGTNSEPFTVPAKSVDITDEEYGHGVSVLVSAPKSNTTNYIKLGGNVEEAEAMTLWDNKPVGDTSISQSGVTVNLDLDGKTWNCYRNTAGSTGTATQMFHLERGDSSMNTVNIENGVIKCSEELNAATRAMKMIFNVYCDLNLKNLNMTGNNVLSHESGCYKIGEYGYSLRMIGINNAEASLENVSITLLKPTQIAIQCDPWAGSNYRNAKVTIKSGCSISNRCLFQLGICNATNYNHMYFSDSNIVSTLQKQLNKEDFKTGYIIEDPTSFKAASSTKEGGFIMVDFNFGMATDASSGLTDVVVTTKSFVEDHLPAAVQTYINSKYPGYTDVEEKFTHFVADHFVWIKNDEYTTQVERIEIDVNKSAANTSSTTPAVRNESVQENIVSEYAWVIKIVKV